jgi:hypothetical protein
MITEIIEPHAKNSPKKSTHDSHEQGSQHDDEEVGVGW